MDIKQLQLNYLKRQKSIVEGFIELYGREVTFVNACKAIGDNLMDFIKLMERAFKS